MEITYRGKCEVTNEWVYGDLAQNEQGYFIVVDSEAVNNYGDGTDFYATEFYKVREGTVGQYINRDDENHVDIFMGDIVEFKDLRDNSRKVGIVQYANCSFYINTSYMSCYRWTDYEVKVLGNGIDNVDLLERFLD